MRIREYVNKVYGAWFQCLFDDKCVSISEDCDLPVSYNIMKIVAEIENELNNTPHNRTIFFFYVFRYLIFSFFHFFSYLSVFFLSTGTSTGKQSI